MTCRDSDMKRSPTDLHAKTFWTWPYRNVLRTSELDQVFLGQAVQATQGTPGQMATTDEKPRLMPGLLLKRPERAQCPSHSSESGLMTSTCVPGEVSKDPRQR